MKNRAVLILPYFGKMPSYFNLWVSSAAYNSKFDYIIFTDQQIRNIEADNIQVVATTFEKLRQMIQQHIDFPIKLNMPYKLCDYKPAYGEVFQQYIQGYEFWGHCDSDIIWGDLSKFISDTIMDEFDKIYYLGHLTLYRNNAKMNQFYKEPFQYKDCISYKYAFTTNFAMAFDEVGTKYGHGISEVCKRKGIREYRSIDFADTMPSSYNFKLDNIKNNNIEYFEYRNGKIIGHNGLIEREFDYIHLQKRIMHGDVSDQNQYYISPYGFCNTADEAIAQANSARLRDEYNKNYMRTKLITKIKKIKSGALKHLIDSKMGRINAK